MSKTIEQVILIDRWVNASLHSAPGEYQDNELAKLFNVPVKKVCQVTGRVNEWMIQEAKRGRSVLMFWHIYNHRGVWYKLIGDEAAQVKERSELKKTMVRNTTQLRRFFAVSKLASLTSGQKIHLQQVYTATALSCRLALDAYESLLESKRNQILAEYLGPSRKRLQKLLGEE